MTWTWSQNCEEINGPEEHFEWEILLQKLPSLRLHYLKHQQVCLNSKEFENFGECQRIIHGFEPFKFATKQMSHFDAPNKGKTSLSPLSKLQTFLPSFVKVFAGMFPLQTFIQRAWFMPQAGLRQNNFPPPRPQAREKVLLELNWILSRASVTR